jgi:outer membrane protein TolC
MKRIYIICGLMLIGSFAQAQLQAVRSFTVEEAVAYALKNKAEAKNAKLNQDQAKARNWEIIATGLPQLSGGVDYTYYFKRPLLPALNDIFGGQTEGTIQLYRGISNMTTDPAFKAFLEGSIQGLEASRGEPIYFQLKHNVQAAVQLTQLIFDGRYFIGLKATKDFTRTAYLTKAVSDQDVRYNVKKAYYQAQAAQQAQSLLRENLSIVEKLVADTREVYKAGFIEELDVDRLELILANLQNQIQTQTQLAEIAMANLKFQIGMSMKEQIVLTERLNDLREKVQPVTSDFTPSKRPEYELLQTAIRIRGYDVKQREAGYYPSLVGFVNYSGSSQVNDFNTIFQSNSAAASGNNWFQTGIVGLSLKVPIFDSGSRNANVKQAKIEQEKTKNDFDNFMKGLELQIKVSETTYTSSLYEEQNTQKSLTLSEKIYNKSRIKFKEGLGSSFELVQAEQDFTTNQLRKIQATLGVLNSKADLDKAQGVQ